MRGYPANLKILLITLILLSIFLPGCTRREESGKTTIHFVTWKPNVPGVWDEIISTFEREHPGIKIVREIGPHSSTAFHDMLTQKLKNRSRDVDVFLMDVIWPPEFASAGWALRLDELFPESERKKFLESTILANTYKGHIYGLPLFIDSGLLYYRKDLLYKYGYSPPETWPELVEIAEDIMKKEKAAGNIIYGYSGQFKQYEGLVCDMMEFILSNGGYILDQKTGKIGLTEEKTLEAIAFVRDKIIGRIAPRGVLTYQEPESLALFMQGKAIFHRNWPYAWKLSNDPEKSRIAKNVGIARLPHFPGGRSYSTLGGWQVGISAYTEKRDAAWTFASYLASERVQKLIAIKAGKAPTRKALYKDPEVITVNPQFESMIDVFLTSYPRPRSPLYPAISNVLQRFFSRVISSTDTPLERYALEARKEIERVLSLQLELEKSK